MAQPFWLNNCVVRAILFIALFFFYSLAIAADAPTINTEWENERLPTSRTALFEYRQRYVEAINHLNIYPKNYQPSDTVFGSVVDGKPWKQKNAFYISNPQLLIIATKPRFITPFGYQAPIWNPTKEQKITHTPGKTIIRYYGATANHWMYWASIENIRLWGVNARDAGFNFALLDLAQSKNVDNQQSGDMVHTAVPLKGYFHYGTNVSANNLSPAYPAMRIKLKNYQQPTTLNVKLWREKPTTPLTTADYTYVIEVLPDPDKKYFDAITTREDSDVGFYTLLIFDAITLLPLFLVLLGFAIGWCKERFHYRSILRREKALMHIPITTAFVPLDDTREIESVKLIYGSTVIASDYFKRFIAFFRHLFGGEMKSYASLVDRARREAILRLKESEPDCDIFLNCRLVTLAIGGIRKKRATLCVEVIAYATAIRYKK